MERIDRSSLTGPKVVTVVYDKLSVFEFGIAVEVFGLARPEFGEDWYRFEVCSADGSNISAIGVEMAVATGLEALDRADIIVLPGWRAPYKDVPNSLAARLRAANQRGSRIVAICGGAYVLAATGLLKGKSATTHWQFVEDFLRAFPDVNVQDAPLFCKDGNLYTSAGSAAGIDLCLEIVREDFGQNKANAVAKRLVVPALRAGAQLQRARQPILPQNKHHRIAAILDTLRADLAARHKIDDAARLAGLTPRTFMRHFEEMTGSKFGDWMALQRIERAKALLSETDISIELVADACGYESPSSLRRLFQGLEGCSPSAFRSTPPPE